MSKRARPELWDELKPLAREKRRVPTHADALLWEGLRGRQVAGMKFRRQHTIERFIVDFYCADFRLVVEVDGEIHQYTQEQDRIREEFLESLALRVLRFTNDEVETSILQVVARISEEALDPSSEAPPLHAVETGLGGEVHPPGAASAASPVATTPLPIVERGPGGEVHAPTATNASSTSSTTGATR